MAAGLGFVALFSFTRGKYMMIMSCFIWFIYHILWLAVLDL